MPLVKLPAALITAVLIGFGIPATALAQSAVALPVDEAKNDGSFFVFRAQLIFLVKERDVEGIIANSCPDIHLGFGGAEGHGALREYLTVPEAAFSDEYKHLAPEVRAKNWAELQKVLSLGGRFDDQGDFWAPYTWTAEVPDSYDAYTTYFVMGTQVLVRNKPAKDGVAVDSLSYNIVTVPWLGEEFNGEDVQYLPIERPNGKTGFVHRDFLRSQIDYRAQFVKDEAGDWKMCLFLAGD